MGLSSICEFRSYAKTAPITLQSRQLPLGDQFPPDFVAAGAALTIADMRPGLAGGTCTNGTSA
jgi:hypothetical protein